MKNDVLLFACIEKNIGDDLFIKTLCDRYPNTNFIISKDAKYGSIREIDNLKFSLALKYWSLLNSIVGRNMFRRIIKKTGCLFLKILIGSHDYGIMIVGNAFKNYCYEGSWQIKWLEDRRKLTNKFYLISTNFGPFYDNRWVSDCKKIFENIDDVCFRDEKSYYYFQSLRNVRFAPDAIFSMDCKKNGNHDKRIVISVIDCSFPFREDWIKNCTNDYEYKMIEIADYFTDNGYEVVLFNSNAKQDEPASYRIKEGSRNKKKIQIYNYDGNIEDAIDLLSCSSLIVGTRLHTVILSLLLNVPVFPIVYDIKLLGVLNSCGFTEEYIDIKDISKITLEEIINSIEKYSFVLDDSFIKLSNQQFEEIDKVLK